MTLEDLLLKVILLKNREAALQSEILEQLTMKNAELLARLTAVETKLTEVETEYKALKAATADPDVPATVEAKLQAIEARTTTLADITPGGTAPTGPPTS